LGARAGFLIIAAIAAGCAGAADDASTADPAPAPGVAAPETPAPETPAPDAGRGAAVEADVVAEGFEFIDGDVTVELGGELTWVNRDGSAHPLVFSDGRRFDLPGGGSAAVRFDESGLFSYACAVHPTMTGTVTVLGADGSAPADDDAGAADESGMDSGGTSPGYSY
jgi:plastocyanin